MGIWRDFEIFDKISKQTILEEGMSVVKSEYKYYTNCDGNYLARKEGAAKSFELFAQKITNSEKAVVIFMDGTRLIVVYSDFWDTFHKTIEYTFSDELDISITRKQISKLIETIKLFVIGFAQTIYYIDDESANSEIVRKILLEKLRSTKIIKAADVMQLSIECNLIENNVEKSKIIGRNIGVIVIVILLINFGFSMIHQSLSDEHNQKMQIISKEHSTIENEIVIEKEKIVDLEKRLNDGKIWCN